MTFRDLIKQNTITEKQICVAELLGVPVIHLSDIYSGDKQYGRILDERLPDPTQFLFLHYLCFIKDKAVYGYNKEALKENGVL